MEKMKKATSKPKANIFFQFTDKNSNMKKLEKEF